MEAMSTTDLEDAIAMICERVIEDEILLLLMVPIVSGEKTKRITGDLGTAVVCFALDVSHALIASW